MTLPIRRLTPEEIAKKPYGVKADPDVPPTPPPMIGKPTPVRDARTNVKNERSQLADARQQLMAAKATRAKQMAERERMMAEKAAKEAANKPPPIEYSDYEPTSNPTSGGTAPPAFNIGNDLPPIRNPNNIPDGPEGATAMKAPRYAGVVNKSPSTSSGGVMGGVANAVQGAVNKMPMPENVIKPFGMKRGGAVRNKPQTKFASGGSVSSASKRGDGIAQRGKTKGRMC